MYVLAKVGVLPVSWGKVVLYQLSYFRMYVLAKVGGLPVSWGKVVLYQLSHSPTELPMRKRLLKRGCKGSCFNVTRKCFPPKTDKKC